MKHTRLGGLTPTNEFVREMDACDVPSKARAFVVTYACPACGQPIVQCDNGAHYIREALAAYRKKV